MVSDACPSGSVIGNPPINVDVGLRVARAGAGAVLYTDIGRDGMRSGPNLDATARLAAKLTPCPVIASGGVSRLEDLDALVRARRAPDGGFLVSGIRARAGCARRARPVPVA